MFFDESRPDRRKRAAKLSGKNRLAELANSPFPPAKQYNLLEYNDLISGGFLSFVYDVECYKNYFLIAFRCLENGKVVYFELSPNGYSVNGFACDFELWSTSLAYILYRCLVIGFNSRSYDLPMTLVALGGASTEKLKEASDDIIFNELQAYQVERKYGVKALHINHIDLIEVAPITASLKIYSGRLHCERMQDLPYPHDALLSLEQAINVRDYCVNDLDNTELLYKHLKPQIELRVSLGKEYGVDLRSKSDAQIAEAVIASELEKIGVIGRAPKIEPGYQFYYNVPEYVRFKTPQLQRVLEVVRNTPFIVGTGGAALCPQEIADLKPTLGGATYRLGIGGLHSSEETAAHVADASTLLIDRDVASFYPQMILNQELYPEHLGRDFLKVYRAIVTRRLDAKHKAKEAKKAGDKEQASYWATIADALKIVINGTFGKLGNMYSKFYAPDLLIQVTMSGQLNLLMLIEMVHLAGIPVVSANTDGIVIKCPTNMYAELEKQIIIWEETTGLITEETRYKALYSRDVNNYIAIKLKQDEVGNWLDETDGCKTKGVYSEVGSALNSPLSKNPEGYICSMAVQAFLEHGTPIQETVFNHGENVKQKHFPTPISRFVSVRNVKGGAEKDGVFLGKAVRWYYACEETGTINYAVSGNKVPKSEGAKPLMTLPSVMPNDLDYDRYVNDSIEMLYELGVYKKVTKAKFF